MAGAKETDNPLVAFSNRVCVEVACELVKRLAMWTDIEMALDHADTTYFRRNSLSADSAPVALQWEENLKLSFDHANGLYKLAQEVGRSVGESMKQGDRVIDELVERIAKNVAVEIAESLVLRVREFSPVVVSKEKKPKSKKTAIPKVFTPPPESAAFRKSLLDTAAQPEPDGSEDTGETSSGSPTMRE